MAGRRKLAVIAAQDVLAYSEDMGKAQRAFSEVMTADCYTNQGALMEAAQKRAKQYGIGVKEKGHRTPPKGFPTNEADYGDPVNYKYPADAAHARPALGYFNHSGQKVRGGYSSEEWAIIGRRLAKLISKHLKARYAYKGGKLVPVREG